MVIKKNIDVSKPLSEKQIEMLNALKDRPVEFDEDCPELTEEELKQFKRISEANREERRKQTVTLRLSPQALKKAKSLGKGYTSILSRMLENDLSDNEKIKNYL